MSLSVVQLESLLAGLTDLRDRLERCEKSGDALLNEQDPLVQSAKSCEFMLPSVLSVDNLRDTTQKKIGNVEALLERARENEGLAPEARFAADNEDAPIRRAAQPPRL